MSTASLTLLPPPDPATAVPDVPPPTPRMDALAAEVRPAVTACLDSGDVRAAWGIVAAYSARAAEAWLADFDDRNGPVH